MNMQRVKKRTEAEEGGKNIDNRTGNHPYQRIKILEPW